MEDSRSSSPMLHLDLNNFDTNDAEGSRYVLTSPRSLEACARLGVKPVELLHKSLSDFVDENQDVPLEAVTFLYQVHEKERRRLLRLCREEREKIIEEGKGRRSSSKKQAALEPVPEQIGESQRSESKSRNADAGGDLERGTGPQKSESSRSSSTDSMEHNSRRPQWKGIHPWERVVTSLGDLRHTPATERKLERLEREIRKEMSVTVPEKDRKIAALMLVKHMEEQARLLQSERAERQRQREERLRVLRQARAERLRRKELERSTRRWHEGLEVRQRQRQREEMYRAWQREQEAAWQEERWRQLMEEQRVQRRDRQEVAQREAEERKRCQELLLKEREREEQMDRERESRVALGKELKASRSRQIQERRERKRVKLENQQQKLRHLLLKRAVEDQALAQQLQTRNVLETKLHRTWENHEQAVEARQRELRERSAREEEQLQQVRIRASQQEGEQQRYKQVLAKLNEQRRARAARLVQEQLRERVQQTRQANTEKERSHRRLWERVQQQEEELRLQRESGLAHKEHRREQLRKEKEEALEESRRVARASCRMRERVKEHTQSRTFDQLALEAQLTASIGRIKL